MAVITSHKEVAPDIWVMSLKGMAPSLPGQFFMMGVGPGALLLRPLSVMDVVGEETFLCYRVVGEGTRLLATRQVGEELYTVGPSGFGWPVDGEGPATLIGGGMGVVPLVYLAKELTRRGREVTVHLGYRDKEFLREEFPGKVKVNIGGFVTNDVDYTAPGEYFACGPLPMMKAAAVLAKEKGAKLWVSLERRMACGVGACLGCSISTPLGNKRVCKDGPVFLAEELDFEQL